MRKQLFKICNETEELLTLEEVLDFACIGVDTLAPSLTQHELLFLQSLPNSITLELLKTSSVECIYKFYEDSYSRLAG